MKKQRCSVIAEISCPSHTYPDDEPRFIPHYDCDLCVQSVECPLVTSVLVVLEIIQVASVSDWGFYPVFCRKVFLDFWIGASPVPTFIFKTSDGHIERWARATDLGRTPRVDAGANALLRDFKYEGLQDAPRCFRYLDIPCSGRQFPRS